MSDDDLLDIVDLVACCFDCCPQFVLRFVADAAEDVANGWAPNFGVIPAASGFPKDEALVRVVN